jgi:hypothetical protein
MNWSEMPFRPPAPSGYRNLLAPSSAPSLPGLISCRIRSWGHPPELCSSRAAVRWSQRRSPLGVRAAFRVLLHAGVRHPVQLFKLKTERVALLGICPSRVRLSLRWSRFRRTSPRVVATQDASGQRSSTSGSHSQRAWQVSLETANPHGVSSLLMRHVC